MKATFLAVAAIFAGSLANPLPAESTQLAPRTARLDDILAQVEARAAAAGKYISPYPYLILSSFSLQLRYRSH